MVSFKSLQTCSDPLLFYQKKAPRAPLLAAASEASNAVCHSRRNKYRQTGLQKCRSSHFLCSGLLTSKAERHLLFWFHENSSTNGVQPLRWSDSVFNPRVLKPAHFKFYLFKLNPTFTNSKFISNLENMRLSKCLSHNSQLISMFMFSRHWDDLGNVLVFWD